MDGQNSSVAVAKLVGLRRATFQYFDHTGSVYTVSYRELEMEIPG